MTFFFTLVSLVGGLVLVRERFGRKVHSFVFGGKGFLLSKNRRLVATKINWFLQIAATRHDSSFFFFLGECCKNCCDIFAQSKASLMRRAQPNSPKFGMHATVQIMARGKWSRRGAVLRAYRGRLCRRLLPGTRSMVKRYKGLIL